MYSNRNPRVAEQLRMLNRELQHAIAHYATAWTPENVGPWSVAQKVPVSVYEQWSRTLNSAWRVAYVHKTGEVLLYGDPSTVHEYTGGYLSTVLGRQLPDDWAQFVSVGSAPACRLTTRVKEPDFAMHRKGYTHPSIVAEVVYTNETDEEMYRELSEWVEPNKARVALGIRIRKSRGVHARQPKLTFIKCVCGQAPVITEFGTGTGCTALDSVGFNINLNMSDVFHAEPIPAGWPLLLTLPLYGLRQEINAWV